MNSTSESPFRDVNEPIPWRYIEEDDDPQTPERPHSLLALGAVMLVLALCFAMPMAAATPSFVYCIILGASSSLYRDFFLTGVLLMVIGATPVVLPAVMGLGLLHRKPWSVRGSITALLIAVPLGGIVCWATKWVYLILSEESHRIPPFSPQINQTLSLYGVIMIPLMLLLIYLLSRPETAEALLTTEEA